MCFPLNTVIIQNQVRKAFGFRTLQAALEAMWYPRIIKEIPFCVLYSVQHLKLYKPSFFSLAHFEMELHCILTNKMLLRKHYIGSQSTIFLLFG